MDTRSVYRFADCEVDPALRQVRCGGVVAEPQPKALDLLLYLIAHRTRVVDKDELLEKIWPGVVVSESALTQALRKARAMVGDDGERQAVIRTIQRRGFRFVAELHEDTAATRPAPTPEHVSAAPGAVAVLPFTDMSPERDQEYFCDGMAEEVINALARAGQRVVARTSAFAFKNRHGDVREIARNLGVTLVLEGSVRKAGDHLRVTAQLIDAASGFHLWSQSWDRRVEDMFAIQEEIAGRIVGALHESAPQARSAITTDSVTPAELYRRGLGYQRRYGQRNQRFAIELFKQAIARDAAHAPGWAALAMSHVLLYRHTAATAQHRDAALQAACRAVELDASLAEAWTAKGAATTICCDFASAEAAFEKAIRIGPNSFEAHYYYGRAATEMGQFEKAARLYERAAHNEPDDCQALVFAGQAYLSLGRAELALDAERRALAAAERAVARDPTDARALTMGAAGLIHSGRADEARAWIERACALEPEESYVQYNSACAYVILGEHDRALDLLEKIDFAAMSSRGWVEHDPGLDAIREHPRFRRIMGTVR